MIACLDAAYSEAGVGAACGLISDWNAPAENAMHARFLAIDPAPYRSGAFYERELPILTAMLDGLDALPRLIVVDGYVWLSAAREPGLGAHLYITLGEAVPVVGIAKNPRRDDDVSLPVRRGMSATPLYVTAAGMAPDLAAHGVQIMHGAHRIPTVLKRVDLAARDALAGGP